MNCSGRADLDLYSVQGLWCVFSFWRLLILSAHSQQHNIFLSFRNWFKIHSFIWSESQHPFFQLHSGLSTPMPPLTVCSTFAFFPMRCLLLVLSFSVSSYSSLPPLLHHLPEISSSSFLRPLISQTIFLHHCCSCLWAGSQTWLCWSMRESCHWLQPSQIFPEGFWWFPISSSVRKGRHACEPAPPLDSSKASSSWWVKFN